MACMPASWPGATRARPPPAAAGRSAERLLWPAPPRPRRTEHEAEALLAERGMPEEPLFCFETALKACYASLHCYRHFNVRRSVVAGVQPCADQQRARMHAGADAVAPFPPHAPPCPRYGPALPARSPPAPPPPSPPPRRCLAARTTSGCASHGTTPTACSCGARAPWWSPSGAQPPWPTCVPTSPPGALHTRPAAARC